MYNYESLFFKYGIYLNIENENHNDMGNFLKMNFNYIAKGTWKVGNP